MQISCFMQSSILTPYGGILSNDLDFSKLNFVTKIPNFRSSKGPNKKCFLIRELQMRKLFHWHCVFTQTWYLEQEPKWPLTKIFARCDEIMHRDEIRWFDSNEHILTESWLQIVEVAIISVGMSVQDTLLTMFIILPSSNECKAYLTLPPFTVVSAYI